MTVLGPRGLVDVVSTSHSVLSPTDRTVLMGCEYRRVGTVREVTQS